MKTEVYINTKMNTYIMQNFLTEDIIGAFLEYNQKEDQEYLQNFIEQSTVLEVVKELVDNCVDNGESAIDVLNRYVNEHYIIINQKKIDN